jgi:hypothetical protein
MLVLFPHKPCTAKGEAMSARSFSRIKYAYAPAAGAVGTSHHEEEIVFLVNSADPTLVEAYTNSQDLCRQLEEHGAQPICIPHCDTHTLRGQLVQWLNSTYVLKAQQLKFLSIDELKSVLEQRRRDRKRKQAALSEEEKETRAKKAAYAKQWRERQTPEKRQAIRDSIKRARKKETSDYERAVRRQQEIERWERYSPERQAAIRERDRLAKAAKRAQKREAQTARETS